MDCTASRLSYRQTNVFSTIILDYLDHVSALHPFYTYSPDLKGIKEAIEIRKKFTVNRKVLVQELKKQYSTLEVSNTVKSNLDSLLSPDTFTITTAHQNNIFTGPLYFIYKILHVAKITDELKKQLPQYNFVPVYYMGSEDADLDELGHLYINGQKLKWETKQKGAVGRMKIDKELVKIIAVMEGELSVLPFGAEIISLVKKCYKEGMMLQDATLQFVNSLFADWGVLVVIADNAALKSQAKKIFEDDLLNQSASGIVEQTATELTEAGYKIQANPREINLFYLKDDIRERIEERNGHYAVINTDLSFTGSEILKELQDHPERFSPNVILRGIYQETILPNLAYVGGGGEIAYWLQLKKLFQFYNVAYPVLLLRNSFLFVEKKWHQKINKLGFSVDDFFLSEEVLLGRLVKRDSDKKLNLNGTLTATSDIYDEIKKQASSVDGTLGKHVDALKTQSIHRLHELEKKMLRAEKRKFSDQQRQLHTIKEKLFPKHGLQERIDNFIPYYASWGADFMKMLYQNSPTLEQEFVILLEK